MASLRSNINSGEAGLAIQRVAQKALATVWALSSLRPWKLTSTSSGLKPSLHTFYTEVRDQICGVGRYK